MLHLERAIWFTFCVRHGMASIPWHEGTAKVFFESVGAGMQKTMLIASNSTRENWLMLWNQVTKVRNFLQSSFLRFLLLPETTDIRKLGKLALFTAIWIETTTVRMYKCQVQRETNDLHRWFQDTLSYLYIPVLSLLQDIVVTLLEQESGIGQRLKAMMQ